MFDFIRGMAVLFMVLVHVLGIYATSSVQNSPFGFVVDFLGSPPAAPVFMFTMGIFFILSTKTDSLKSGLIRGVKLLALGAILSFLRDDLLTLFESLIWGGESLKLNTMTAIWEVDILQFAGCAYILMTLIKHRFKKPIWWLLIAFTVIVTGPYLWGIQTSSVLLNWFLHFLWGNSELVYFPQFSWIYYPLLGMIFGICMKATSDMKVLMHASFKTGSLFLLLGSLISFTDLDYHIGDYFTSGPGAMLWILGFILIWLCASYYISKSISHLKLYKTISYWGQETTAIYCIHWVLVMWMTLVLGYESQSATGVLLLTALFLFSSHAITYLYNNYRLQL